MFRGKKYQETVILLVIFFLSITGLELFILQKQTYINTNFFMLWISIVVAFITIFLSIILKVNWSISFSMILITSFFLSIMFVPAYGLFGSDANYDYHLIKLIDEFGWSPRMDDLAPWPMIHLFIDITSKIINVSLLDSSRWLPSITSTIVFFFLFCLSKRMNKNYSASIMYIFLFSTIIYYFFFHSMPLRENFGYLFLFAALYCQSVALEVKDARFKFLSIFLGLVLIISHHFSAFIYLVYLISLTIGQNLFSIIKNFNYFSERYSRNLGYSLLILVSILYYWLLVNRFAFYAIIDSANSFLNLGEKTKIGSYFSSIYPPLVDLQPFLLRQSSRATFIITILLIIIYIYKNYNKLTQYDISIFIFTIFLGIVFILSNYGFIEMDVYPERVQLFSWAFLLILLSKILIEFIDLPGIFNKRKLISILFIISFITMNYTGVYSFQYDPGIRIPYDYGQIREFHLETEYIAPSWFNMYANQNINNGLIQTDRAMSDLLIYIKSDRKVTEEEFFRQNNSFMFNDTDWAIIRMEMFKRIISTEIDNDKIKKPLNMTISAYNIINQKMAKIYTNREVDIYNKSAISAR